jgi:hypothetical protein
MVAYRMGQALAALSFVLAALPVTAARAEDPARATPEPVRFRMVDVSGEPVPGARVWLVGGPSSYGTSRLLATVASDADGFIEVPKELESSCAIVAAEGTRLGWSAQARLGTDVVLAPATSTLRGWVLPLPGTPIRDVRVRVRTLARAAGGTPGGFIVIPGGTGLLSSEIGAGGAFSIHGVPEDCRFGLTIERPGSADVTWGSITTDHPQTLVELPAQQVEVVVRDHEGRPLAGLWVTADPLWGQRSVGTIYFPQQWAQTDCAGRAVFSRLYRGHRYQLTVNHAGWYSHPAEVPPGTREPFPSVELVADHGGRVDGRITRTDASEPIARGYIVFTPEGHPRALEFRSTSAAVGPHGEFATTLPEGTYVLSWFEFTSRMYTLHYEPGVRVTVREGQTASVVVTLTDETPVRKVPVRP